METTTNSESVVPPGRRLRPGWSIEEVEDLKRDYGMEAEAHLLSFMGHAVSKMHTNWIEAMRPWHWAFLHAKAWASLITAGIDLALSGRLDRRGPVYRYFRRVADPIEDWFVPKSHDLTPEEWEDVSRKAADG